MNKYIVGLTGGIGSGKTTVANLFIALGVEVVDADEVSREVVLPGSSALSSIVEHFGTDFLLSNGALNRPKLREKVFSDNDAKLWLNQLLHPAIRELMLLKIAKTQSRYCLLVAPLLLENGLDKFVDSVLVIDVDKQTQIDRTKHRDGSTLATIESIIKSQISSTKRVAAADYIIDNNSTDLLHVKQQVTKLHQTFTELACQKLKD